MSQGPYGPRAPGPRALPCWANTSPKNAPWKKRVKIVFFVYFLKTKKMRGVRTIILAAVSRRDLCYVSENEGFRFGGAHVLSGSDFLNSISYLGGPIWFSDPTFLFFGPGKSESEFLLTSFSYTKTWVQLYMFPHPITLNLFRGPQFKSEKMN